MSIVSYFDQFPEFEGIQVSIRGDDGYFDSAEMSKAMQSFDGKRHRFSDWSKSGTAQRLLTRLSGRSGIAITRDFLPPTEIGGKAQVLIDYTPGRGQRTWLHPYVAIAFAMSVPEFQAEVSIWMVDLMKMGTVNPHVLRWTQEEYLRGVDYNRDDITDMYG